MNVITLSIWIHNPSRPELYHGKFVSKRSHWVLSLWEDEVPVSISDKTSYCKILWSLEAARLVVYIITSLWNLTSTSAALLSRCLWNFRAIVQFLVHLIIMRLIEYWNRTEPSNNKGTSGLTICCSYQLLVKLHFKMKNISQGLMS